MKKKLSDSAAHMSAERKEKKKEVISTECVKGDTSFFHGLHVTILTITLNSSINCVQLHVLIDLNAHTFLVYRRETVLTYFNFVLSLLEFLHYLLTYIFFYLCLRQAQRRRNLNKIKAPRLPLSDEKRDMKNEVSQYSVFLLAYSLLLFFKYYLPLIGTV